MMLLEGSQFQKMIKISKKKKRKKDHYWREPKV